MGGISEKRFKLGYVCGDFGLIDNDEWIDLHSMSENSEKNVQICINKMNELHEENQEFRKRTKELIAVSLDYQTINLDLIAEAIKSLRELIE